MLWPRSTSGNSNFLKTSSLSTSAPQPASTKLQLLQTSPHSVDTSPTAATQGLISLLVSCEAAQRMRAPHVALKSFTSQLLSQGFVVVVVELRVLVVDVIVLVKVKVVVSVLVSVEVEVPVVVVVAVCVEVDGQPFRSFWQHQAFQPGSHSCSIAMLQS